MTQVATTSTTTPTPTVTLVGDKAVADTRDIAAFFDRSHKAVLVAVRTALARGPDLLGHKIVPMFEDVAIANGAVREVMAYRLDRDAFRLIVMGFTGERAFHWKLAYIDAFNRMESELARRSLPVAADPMSMLYDVDVLIPLLATMAQRAKVAEARVEAAQPAVDFCEALADSDDTWGLQAAGKALHQGPNRFVDWLRDRGDLFNLDGGPVPKQPLIDRGLFIVIWRKFGDNNRPTTRLTGKGIVHYAHALGVRPPQAPSQALLPGI
ncbi:phage regulatory protein/antirepressor Ant [Methylobacterium sp. J-059]|uniref:phage regulatory protein/antirepressor Ant n=1 Tax=Methylobacterium sp. J-059 TaxID=2836643 RepID=UPI001FBB440D|nr:phage regulatory protein/antirepressor Ant [Methylobacterium sp. J-059]MCJ2040949.1 phage regulatory protein/antirepressor Ant [Methylobacterium sp. J-059]